MIFRFKSISPADYFDSHDDLVFIVYVMFSYDFPYVVVFP